MTVIQGTPRTLYVIYKRDDIEHELIHIQLLCVHGVLFILNAHHKGSQVETQGASCVLDPIGHNVLVAKVSA